MFSFRFRQLAALSAVSLLTGCGNAAAWLAGEPPSTEKATMQGAAEGLAGRGLWSGEMSQAQSQISMQARTEAEWLAIWQLVGQAPPGPLPDRLMALAVFLGARNSGGYNVSIVRIGMDRLAGQRDQVRVEFREAKPEGVAPMVITSPWSVVLIDRSDADIHYVRVP
jgi:hypothetical protein